MLLPIKAAYCPFNEKNVTERIAVTSQKSGTSPIDKSCRSLPRATVQFERLTLMIKRLHHAAIIVSSEAGVEFYKALGFMEENRIDRGYDQIVWLSGYGARIEIFIDGTHPARVTGPEAFGLRHLAFEVEDADAEWERLRPFNPEPIRIKGDGRKVFFVKDPDGLPIEMRD